VAEHPRTARYERKDIIGTLDIDAVDAIVRECVGRALRVSVEEWPASQPLVEVPDGLFDSLAKLEMITTIEREVLPDSPHDGVDYDDFDTVAGITAWVMRRLDEHP
jgi:hypothetical protein